EYPIEVPPGRLGLEPGLALAYHSDGSVYGGIASGWTLAVPSIAIDTLQGILGSAPRYVSAMAGGEPLLETSEPRGPQVDATYRARFDSTHARYERMAAAAGYAWQVRTLDGRVYRFGERGPLAQVEYVGS